MSQRVKRPNRSEDGSIPVKRRKVNIITAHIFNVMQQELKGAYLV